MLGVAFARLEQCLPVLVAVRHRNIWDTRHFHDMAVASWVCIVGSLSLGNDLTVAIRKDKIIWECENGGQQWGLTEEAGYDSSSSFPNAICGPGWQSLFTAFIVSLLVDLAFQVGAKSSPEWPWLLTSPISRGTRVVIEDVRFLPQLALQEENREIHPPSEFIQ